MSANLDRFYNAEPAEIEYSGVLCVYCEELIEIGAEVRETYDNETVHDDCWRSHCDEVYCARRGVMGHDGIE